MLEKAQGSIRLFQIRGINVFLHWSWFLVAIFEIQSRAGKYNSILWNILEYLAIFVIVLLHEFGHSLACRQVGGQADRIVLWPLGGVAFVSPPQRPGAQLWSIAAGPLVNVALAPIFYILMLATRAGEFPASDLHQFFGQLLSINFVLLVFNLLPVYPLDGGQILRSLLWFLFGRANSLMVASIVGFIGVAGILLVALALKEIWLIIIGAFVLMTCWGALKHARALARIAKAPRREGFICPSCRLQPPRGTFWICSNCRNPFDTFGTDAMCPHCMAHFSTTTCPECGAASPVAAWADLTPTNKNF